uniref:Uncharacterized protein n=2 Tax=Chrysotila carterae TaxID=13221 RepID=A0A7S4B5N1_CHRCT
MAAGELGELHPSDLLIQLQPSIAAMRDASRQGDSATLLGIVAGVVDKLYENQVNLETTVLPRLHGLQQKLDGMHDMLMGEMETSAAVAAAERQAASLRELTSRSPCLAAKLQMSDSAKPAPIMATAIQNRTASQPSPESTCAGSSAHASAQLGSEAIQSAKNQDQDASALNSDALAQVAKHIAGNEGSTPLPIVLPETKSPALPAVATPDLGRDKRNSLSSVSRESFDWDLDPERWGAAQQEAWKELQRDRRRKRQNYMRAVRANKIPTGAQPWNRLVSADASMQFNPNTPPNMQSSSMHSSVQHWTHAKPYSMRAIPAMQFSAQPPGHPINSQSVAMGTQSKLPTLLSVSTYPAFMQAPDAQVPQQMSARSNMPMPCVMSMPMEQRMLNAQTMQNVMQMPNSVQVLNSPHALGTPSIRMMHDTQYL